MSATPQSPAERLRSIADEIASRIDLNDFRVAEWADELRTLAAELERAPGVDFRRMDPEDACEIASQLEKARAEAVDPGSAPGDSEREEDGSSRAGAQDQSPSVPASPPSSPAPPGDAEELAVLVQDCFVALRCDDTGARLAAKIRSLGAELASRTSQVEDLQQLLDEIAVATGPKAVGWRELPRVVRTLTAELARERERADRAAERANRQTQDAAAANKRATEREVQLAQEKSRATVRATHIRNLNETLAATQRELADERAIWCDKPEDRLYHAEDRTWWRRDPETGRCVAAEPPAELARAELEQARDYEDMRRFQRKYIAADQRLRVTERELAEARRERDAFENGYDEAHRDRMKLIDERNALRAELDDWAATKIQRERDALRGEVENLRHSLASIAEGHECWTADAFKKLARAALGRAGEEG